MKMEEQKTVERPLMSEEEFKDYMEKNRVDVVGDFYDKNILHLRTFEATSKFKSVRRAIKRAIKRVIKRGHVTLDGVVMPKRSFSNRGNTSNRNGKHSRGINERRKEIYGKLKYRQSA